MNTKLFVYRFEDYTSPSEAKTDGALYDTGVSLDLNQLKNIELMQMLFKVAITTSDCINADMSKIKLVWMDEKSEKVVSYMHDLIK